MRIGIGFDIHKLVKAKPLILGGIEIPFSFGLLSHSDGDIVIHSISDAILGAIAKDDIGTLFPDSSSKYKNISSTKILKKVNDILVKNKFKIENIDVNIITEIPKLQPFYLEMRKSIAKLLKIHISQISIKARTMERLGEIGKKKAMASYAVVSIEKIKTKKD